MKDLAIIVGFLLTALALAGTLMTRPELLSAALERARPALALVETPWVPAAGVGALVIGLVARQRRRGQRVAKAIESVALRRGFAYRAPAPLLETLDEGGAELLHPGFRGVARGPEGESVVVRFSARSSSRAPAGIAPESLASRNRSSGGIVYRLSWEIPELPASLTLHRARPDAGRLVGAIRGRMLARLDAGRVRLELDPEIRYEARCAPEDEALAGAWLDERFVRALRAHPEHLPPTIHAGIFSLELPAAPQTPEPIEQALAAGERLLAEMRPPREEAATAPRRRA